MKPSVRKKFVTPETGKLLVAEPFQKESFFKRAVVLICQHDQKGTVGLIINKITDLMINDAIEDFPQFEAAVYFGGPEKTDNIFYVHTYGEEIEGSVKIADGIYWGGNFELLKVLIESNKIDLNRIRFIAGYCGWLPEEFNKDLKENLWWVSEANKKIIFEDNADDTWGHALSDMGNQYAIMSHFSEDPNSN